LVDELHPTRDASRNPLFQVTYAPQTPFSITQMGDLTLEPLHVETQTAKFDLTLFSADTPQGISEAWEYNTDLFDAERITQMAGHYHVLLEAVVADAQQHIAELPLLTPEERQQILVTWNATHSDYPSDKCAHTIFEAYAAQQPEATALIFQDEYVSYRDLNQRANQLAHALRAMGVGPETIVGLCVERSIEMMIGMLGILKAGGVYLPLDPTYPQERLAFMLQDTQTPILLTQRHLVARLPQYEAHVICLDTGWSMIAQNSVENVASGATAENLAYIMYTSGSTGKPKGVCITHRNIARLVKGIDYLKLDAEETCLQLATICFDASTLEIWGALLNGGRLGIYPPQQPTFEELAVILKKYQVTMLVLTTGLFHQMVEQQPEGLLTVRQLLVGGDVLSASHAKQMLGQSWGGHLINAYGPTENTTIISCYSVTDDSQIDTSIPIGHPIANTQVYILDQHLQPVPVGMPGELFSGGDGVARGYWNRPALTAEKFIPNPFDDKASTRLYRTGDLARYRSDGVIEFLGRIDNQVKIRSYRIELGEIEATLTAHPVVQEAIVLAREDSPNQKRLVAYVTLHPHKTLTISEMHSFLRNRLPDYMLPAALVQLDTMPLNTNGKVDRRALPAPEFGRPELAQAFAAPRTPVEKRLVNIWREVLGIEKIGIHDNFFELGGDSILSIQIVAKANQAGLRLTPKQFFQYQTVAKLAAAADVAPVIQVEQEIVTGPVPLTPIQHWFFEQNLPNPHHWNQTMLLETRRPLDPALLATTVQYLLEHHDALRLRFKREGVDWQQINTTLDGNVPFVHVDLSAIPVGEQRVALEAHAAKLQASLDLGEGPLLRVTSFSLGLRRAGRLLVIIHHLAVDNVSWRILLGDLQTVYTQLSRGEKIELPPKTLAFKTWGERLVDYARTAQLQSELPYWLTQTEALPHTLLSEGAKNLAMNTEASARTLTVTLSVEETRALLQDVPAVYRTQVNEVLLTALAQAHQRWAAYHAWAGTTALRVDLEGHGREDILPDADLSRTVGWFTSIFPVRLDLSNTYTPGDALKSIKEQLRGIPNKGIGYGILRYLAEDTIREELRSRQPAEISFNYLGQFDRVLPEPSLFRPTREPYGPEHSPYGQRRYLLEIEGGVSGEQLWVNWTYSENLHQRGDIEVLAHGFIEALRGIIAHCQTPGAGGYTPSDFPEAGLAQEELDALLAQLDEGIE
jgi:amino acid adenylation domain-containing protein/non-ribosomal peptide synthase protein (TIGR01720 family)